MPDLTIRPAADPAASTPALPSPDAVPESAAPDYTQLLASLSQVPEIQAVQSGQLGAVFAPETILGEHHEAVFPHLQAALPTIGLQLTEAKNAKSLVVYNPKVVTTEQIAAADKAGDLTSVASPLSAESSAAPAPAPSPADVAAPLMSSPQTPGAVTAARIAYTAPKTPSAQAHPAQGIVNSLFRRAT